MVSQKIARAFDKNVFIEHLSCVPHMVINQINKGEVDHLAHDVLAGMCKEGGLPLDRAAFVVDNKDFGCSLGVAAFHRDEALHATHKQKVCAYQACAMGNDGIAACAKNLGFCDYDVCSIPMKNGNMGVFIYEKNEEMEHEDVLSSLPYALAFLALCPLF